jgi:hypothetical protein
MSGAPVITFTLIKNPSVTDFVMEVDLKHPGDIIKRAKIVNGPGYPISTIMPIADDRYYTIILVDRCSCHNVHTHQKSISRVHWIV